MDAVELLQARLLAVELETKGCYGTLSFWCDYYREDEQKVKDMKKQDSEVDE